MSAAHILIKEVNPDDPEEFRYRIECQLGDACDGWWECDKLHEVDGLSAHLGPNDSEPGAPWDAEEEFGFHGVLHTWRDGHGWTVPFEGCVVEVSDFDPPDEVLELPVGRYEVDDEWDDTSLYLNYVGPEA